VTVDFDIGIIGGGPAGAGIAAYLAKAGVRCVVFEREVFPRPHVGESLVPSSTRVFRELGFLETMSDAGFPKKYGAAWTAPDQRRLMDNRWHDLAATDDLAGADDMAPSEYAGVEFRERPQPGVPLDHTWHVDRAKFDQLLLAHAERLGATVYQGAAVRDVAIDPADGVELAVDLGGRRRSFRARMVVDASGRRTLMGAKMGWKVKDPVFDQFAVHTWFGGYDRSVLAPGDREKQDFIYVHFLPGPNTWVWQIPIDEDVTSVGVVTQKANFSRRRSEHDAFFREQLATRPLFAETLAGAEQLRPLKTEGDYSYAMTEIVGDRLVLIGDAARFVDPIFSTGVSIALNSARFASRDILAALEAGDFSRAAFSTYATTVRRGTKNWYDFISAYYRLNVLFTAFVNDPRYRLDVLKLLQGDVYDEDAPPVLQRMRDIVSEVERNPAHVLHGLLNDLTANAFAPQF
jgi:FADH2 O2-dependent halogenase